METLALLLLSFLCTYTPSHGAICRPTSCRSGGPAVLFPFQLLNRQDYGCGFPGFDLSCDSQNQTILNLPNAGDFTVNRIDYVNQWIFISDPGSCLPERILNFTLSGSQVKGANLRNLMFYNCSMDLNQYLLLTWREPNCQRCEGDGGICRFKDDSGIQIGCFDPPRRRGLPRSAKYGIIIGVGVPGLVSLIGLGCYIGSRIKSCGQRHQHDVELANSEIAPPPAVIMTGLNWRIIESYPKTVLGESRRLPNPNDVTCPICLAEYQPKDTLRTIPECNHYFHATCVDEWLKLNATCPLCRKSPAESSVVTPSSSMSLTPSSSSSSSAT